MENCNKCNGNAKPSKALLNQLVSFNDFGNDAGSRGTTQSRSGKAELVDCLKCTDCGHSWIPENIEVPQEIKDRLEYLRGELRNECISYGELIELESLSKYIDSNDIELLGAINFEDHE